MPETKEDIRSLITSRKRKRVPPRDSSLVSIPDRSSQVHESEVNNSDVKSGDISGLQAELDGLPKMGKRLAVHLEKGVREVLMRSCEEKEITPETFIEASVVLLHERSELLDQIFNEAKSRLAQRKRAGLLRRTMTMMQKF